MRIGIITLPLHTNYGGVLQAFALQAVLRELGHDAIHLQLDEVVPVPKGFRGVCIRSKRSLKRLLGQNVEVDRERRICEELPVVGGNIFRFIGERMEVRHFPSYSDVPVDEFDAFVVGSDQIWRPLYSHNLTDAFLGFTRGADVRRVAFAPSFGVDHCEYGALAKRRCGALLSAFDAVSVREESGIKLCKEMFGVEAVCMPDPTMLLDSEKYLKDVPVPEKPYVFAYILDKDPARGSILVKASGTCKAEPVVFNSVDPRGLGPVEERIQPSIEDWLSGIAASKLVVTDSFHACVFSILFHRPFLVISNEGRGLSRIESLLSKFGLSDRLLVLRKGESPNVDSIVSSPIDWDKVDSRLSDLRASAFGFLKSALS